MDYKGSMVTMVDVRKFWIGQQQLHISNNLANFVSQISLFVNSQNNMGRKKDLISNSLANFVSKNLKTR
jgi:hypothetical protein